MATAVGGVRACILLEGVVDEKIDLVVGNASVVIVYILYSVFCLIAFYQF